MNKKTGGTEKVLVSIPDEFLKVVDDVAKQEYRSRSELVREALRWYSRFKKI